MAHSPLNDTTQPVDSEEEGRSSTKDRQWLIKNGIFRAGEGEGGEEATLLPVQV